MFFHQNLFTSDNQSKHKMFVAYATDQKQSEHIIFLEEYKKVVNLYIDLFWNDCPEKTKLVKEEIHKVKDTWLTYF